MRKKNSLLNPLDHGKHVHYLYTLEGLLQSHRSPFRVHPCCPPTGTNLDPTNNRWLTRELCNWPNHTLGWTTTLVASTTSSTLVPWAGSLGVSPLLSITPFIFTQTLLFDWFPTVEVQLGRRWWRDIVGVSSPLPTRRLVIRRNLNNRHYYICTSDWWMKI